MCPNPKTCGLVAAAVLALAASAACRNSAADRLAANGIAPVYNPRTGRLEQLVSDRDHNGTKETRAYMDGAAIKYIEIDRNSDGAPDRWEYYSNQTVTAGEVGQSPSVIDHAEEANGPDKTITRREFYVGGVIRRVVDDTNFDGRPDKWEQYDQGVLQRVDLDLVGRGVASQRLNYDAAGRVTSVQSDPDGTGVFRAVEAVLQVKR
jgi:hypothetical protein